MTGGPPDESRSRPVEPKLDFTLPEAAPLSRKRFTTVALAVGGLLLLVFVVGFFQRRAEKVALAESNEAARRALPRLEVVAPKLLASDRALSLPGSVQPLQETVIYPRASGYVRAWKVDIGDRVKKGQVLAEIETPELDQELLQAAAQLKQTEAQRTQAQANRNLAKANLARAERLAPSGIVSRADLEQQQAQAEVGDANVKVADANVAAQRANIQRLRQLKAFARVTAPFAGAVTLRSVEIGSLVTSGNNQPLFRIADVDPARIFVQVPQDVAPSVRAGAAADVAVREYPGRKFPGTVTRAAGELDASTRTMTTEVRVPNHEGALMAGMYAEVALTLPSPHRVLEVPATALMNDSRGQRVAVVEGGKLRLLTVVVERDNGATIDVSSGLKGDEKIAKIGSAAFVDGMAVEVRQPAGGPAQ